jgi:hypothetical protein
MEGRVLDAVTVYLADVEVGADFGDLWGGDVVGGAPDALGGFVLVCRALADPFIGESYAPV